MKKTAIILGATGLTGGILLKKLLDDERYEKVKVFTRNPLQLEDLKLEEYRIDLFELETVSNLFKADEVFCCIGSTQKKTPDKDIYRKVDFGIPATVARLCKENAIDTLVVISALGANEKSRFFYPRVKGEMEGAILECKIPNTYILQPALIGGNRQENRPFESIWKNAMKVFDKVLFGKLKKYKTIHPETIVQAMLIVANEKYKKNRIESEEIKELVASKK